MTTRLLPKRAQLYSDAFDWKFVSCVTWECSRHTEFGLVFKPLLLTARKEIKQYFIARATFSLAALRRTRIAGVVHPLPKSVKPAEPPRANCTKAPMTACHQTLTLEKSDIDLRLIRFG